MLNPYAGRPDYQFWRRAGGHDRPEEFDPVTRTKFVIQPSDSVVTAGSCFAQHLSRHLALNGFNVLVTERAHPLIPDEHAAEFHYGLFSARYGNIYTARQLRQLLERSYGLFVPRTRAWEKSRDCWVDPFRPQIQPGGYISVQELELDREIHLAAVRAAVEKMTIFVFTLGLTEAWVDRSDGAVFPLAPGVAGGKYDPDDVMFVNFSARQTIEDLEWSLGFIRRQNPTVKCILTVSPVPLNATAMDRHVWVSTTYSKAALRVAAEEVAANLQLVDYFPSYEIITSPHAGSAYFAKDRRSVTEAGVEHVMRTFFRHYGRAAEPSQATATAHKPSAHQTIDAREASRREVVAMGELMQTLCDEEAIDNAG